MLAGVRGDEALVSQVQAALERLGKSNMPDVAKAATAALLERRGEEAPSSPVQQPTSTARPSMPESLEAHLAVVSRRILDGRVVVFVGPKMNVAPSSHAEHPVPSDWELARELAATYRYEGNNPPDLATVSQYVATIAGTGPLYDSLRAILNRDYQPTNAHRALSSLCATVRAAGAAYPIVFTLDYDNLLERALEAAKVPVDLFSYVAHGSEVGKFAHFSPTAKDPIMVEAPHAYRGPSLDESLPLMKCRGGLGRENPGLDTFVITEDDYIDWFAGSNALNLIPITIAAKVRRSSVLFVGVSLTDRISRTFVRRLIGGPRLNHASWSVGGKLTEFEWMSLKHNDTLAIEMPPEAYLWELDRYLLLERPRIL
jgi:hypothetical protein